MPNKPGKRLKLNPQELLDLENVQLQKLNEIVCKAVEEEKLLSDKLLEFEDRNPPLVSRVADKIAGFGGSWKFIFAFTLFMLIWILQIFICLVNPSTRSLLFY